jgi:hypothetical protein
MNGVVVFDGVEVKEECLGGVWKVGGFRVRLFLREGLSNDLLLLLWKVVSSGSMGEDGGGTAP